MQPRPRQSLGLTNSFFRIHLVRGLLCLKGPHYTDQNRQGPDERICDLAQHTVLEGGNVVQASTLELGEPPEGRCELFL